MIRALREIGNHQVTEEEEKKIVELLKKENRKDLLHNIKLAPVWIQKIMQKAV